MPLGDREGSGDLHAVDTYSHMGIQGNDLADQAAKNCAGRPQEFIPIPYRAWIPNMKRRMYELCEESWREERRD